MANVFDVAAFILRKCGPMTTMKLQKLVYYSQAWSLVWDERPLFKAKIYAWTNGPVVRSLYDKHRGQYLVNKISDGDASKLTDTQKETVNAVLNYYGDKSSQYLSDLTHMEDPWKKARKGLPDDTHSDAEITLISMLEYYSSLPPGS